MQHLARYRLVWKALRWLLVPWLKRKFRYAPESCTIQGPFLLLANHNTDWDPLLLACAFPEYLCFVASEHVFRWGLTSRLLRALFAPISRLKGTTASATARAVLRRLHDGVSVAIFAEGDRSFNGLTGEILPSTGKLARVSGAALVTYRIEGGYFTSPRWAGKALRRGKMTGTVAHVYTPDELRAMTVEEINEAIRRDLAVDAYAVQRREMVPFRGRRLAEHLETVLCLCPRCGAIGTLHSADDVLRCDCGFSVRYNEYGFFEGADAPCDNLTDWDAAQTAELLARIPADGGVIFSDTDMVLREIYPGHRSQELGSGTLTLYADRLVCCGAVFPLRELTGFLLHGPQDVDLSCGGRSYEISSDQVRCTRKYMLVIRHLLSGIHAG
jgi:1-acyl-sn-glycerol-3-phosphate acyltransferase